MSEIKFNPKHYKVRDNVPLEAIRDLCTNVMIDGKENSQCYKDAIEDICDYTAQLMDKEGGIYCHKSDVNVTTSSCIKFINEHSMQDYINGLMIIISRVLIDNDRDYIPVLESHYKHLFGLWFSRKLKKDYDIIASEIMLVFISDSIGWLRSRYRLGESEAVKKCNHLNTILNKSDLDLTNEELEILIKTNNVHHRRCDVCGCELEMPDRGVFGRAVLNTTSCTVCDKGKIVNDLLGYVEDLRKKHDKAMVLEILEERMEDTWGKGNLFTYEDWKKLQEGEKKNVGKSKKQRGTKGDT